MDLAYINPLHIIYATTGLFVIYSFLFYFIIRGASRLSLIPVILIYLVGSYFLIVPLEQIIRHYFKERGELIFYTDEGLIVTVVLMGICLIISVIVAVIAFRKRKN